MTTNTRRLITVAIALTLLALVADNASACCGATTAYYPPSHTGWLRAGIAPHTATTRRRTQPATRPHTRAITRAATRATTLRPRTPLTTRADGIPATGPIAFAHACGVRRRVTSPRIRHRTQRLTHRAPARRASPVTSPAYAPACPSCSSCSSCSACSASPCSTCASYAPAPCSSCSTCTAGYAPLRPAHAVRRVVAVRVSRVGCSSCSVPAVTQASYQPQPSCGCAAATYNQPATYTQPAAQPQPADQPRRHSRMLR